MKFSCRRSRYIRQSLRELWACNQLVGSSLCYGEVITRLVSGQTLPQVSQALGYDVYQWRGRVLPAPRFAKLCRARWDMQDAHLLGCAQYDLVVLLG
jgi:hypothetical protein